DVVLMDIRMPRADGLEATRRIGADRTLDAVRVLVLTTYEADEYVFEALRAGAAGFLLKDIDPDDRPARRVRGEELGAGLDLGELWHGSIVLCTGPCRQVTKRRRSLPPRGRRSQSRPPRAHRDTSALEERRDEHDEQPDDGDRDPRGRALPGRDEREERQH